MAFIRVTGTTLHIDLEFFPEGEHTIPDELLPRLQGLAGVTILPPVPQVPAKTPKPKE